MVVEQRLAEDAFKMNLKVHNAEKLNSTGLCLLGLFPPNTCYTLAGI